jgi:hypothetical protein
MVQAALASPRRVEAGFGTPGRQNRWTVAFRLILLIPQIVVVFVLVLAGFVIVVLGWFAALVMGRLPAGFARYLSNLVQYTTRVSAYGNLLLDRYPPFGFDREYPVNVDIQPGPVRRLAVLFRIFLLIPANIVSSLASAGVGLVAVLIWLIVLVAGRMPLPLFEAEAAILRFQARVVAYAVMLTGKYPGELFGDADTGAIGSASTSAPVAEYGTLPPPIPAYGTPPPPSPTSPSPTPPLPPLFGAPTDVPPAAPGAPPSIPPMAAPPSSPSYWAPPPPSGSPPPPPPPGVGAPGFGAPANAPPIGPPKTGRIVLSKAAKRLVALFLVLGVVNYAINATVTRHSLTGLTALTTLTAAHRALADEVNGTVARQKRCASGDVSCVEAGDGQLADSFQRFLDKVDAISFPASAQSAATTLENSATALVAVLRQLSHDSPNAYAADASRFATAANQFDTSYSHLAEIL